MRNKQLSVCIESTYTSRSSLLYFMFSPEYTSDENQPCMVLINIRSTIKLMKNSAYSRVQVKQQITTQNTNMIAKLNNNEPIILSQFISPIANAKLTKDWQWQHGLMYLPGMLYMNEKLEQSSPIKNAYRFRSTE